MEIMSININSIIGKVQELIKFVKDENIDITCLQETKYPKTDYTYSKIEKIIQGIIYVHSNLDHQGTAIFERQNLLKFKIINLEIQGINFQNRIVHIQTLRKETLNIVSIYAPSSASENKAQFYKTLYKYLMKYKNYTLFLYEGL